MIIEIESIEHLYEMLPKECIDACSCPGDNYRAVDFWVRELKLKIPKKQCIDMLREYGAWPVKELNSESSHNLNCKLLWLAAGTEEF